MNLKKIVSDLMESPEKIDLIEKKLSTLVEQSKVTLSKIKETQLILDNYYVQFQKTQKTFTILDKILAEYQITKKQASIKKVSKKAKTFTIDDMKELLKSLPEEQRKKVIYEFERKQSCQK